MIRKTGLALTLAAMGLTAAGLALFPGKAQAQQYVCGSGPGYGERLVYIQPASNGIAEIPFCERDGSADAAPPPPTIDPRDQKMAIMAEATQGLANSMDYMLKIAHVQAGSWQYSSPGQSCSATFIAPEGFVRIDGPTRKMRYPLLTFYSTRVARQGYQAVDILLENSSLDSGQGATLPVKGLNWPSQDGKGGFLSLQIASKEVLIRALDDNMRFRLSVAGRPAVNISWHGGNEAKAHLAQCLRVRV